MVGARRRRRNSKAGSAKSSGSDIGEEVVAQVQPILPEDSVSVHGDDDMDVDQIAQEPTSAQHSTLALDDSDDPFAYDSELETLSSVSSHSSISSSGSSLLDRSASLSAPTYSHSNDNGLPSDDEHLEDSQPEEEDNSTPLKAPRAQSVESTADLSMAEGDEDPDSPGERLPYGASVSNNEAAADKAASESQASDNDEDIDGDADNESDTNTPTAAAAQFMSKSSAGISARRISNHSLRHSQGSSGPSDEEDDADADADSDSETDGKLAAFPKMVSAVHTPDSGDRDTSPRINGLAEDAAAARGGIESESDNDVPLAEATGARSLKKESDEDDDNEEPADDADVIANESRRTEALMELTCIEIEFAKLRERLYIERLEQVQIEEDYLVSGQHSDYERHIEEITSNHLEYMERLKFGHHAWLQQKQQQHDSWMRTINYTFLAQRQELRTRLLEAQRRRLWRLRDTRIQEDQRFIERATVRYGATGASKPFINGASAADEDLALITQQADSIQQMKRARRSAQTAQRVLVHRRKQRLAVPGLNPAEMDADYMAMNMPVYPREALGGLRRIYVPPLIGDAGSGAAAGPGKKRKPRQQRQPRKKQAVEGGNGTGSGVGDGAGGAPLGAKGGAAASVGAGIKNPGVAHVLSTGASAPTVAAAAPLAAVPSGPKRANGAAGATGLPAAVSKQPRNPVAVAAGVPVQQPRHQHPQPQPQPHGMAGPKLINGQRPMPARTNRRPPPALPLKMNPQQQQQQLYGQANALSQQQPVHVNSYRPAQAPHPKQQVTKTAPQTTGAVVGARPPNHQQLSGQSQQQQQQQQLASTPAQQSQLQSQPRRPAEASKGQVQRPQAAGGQVINSNPAAAVNGAAASDEAYGVADSSTSAGSAGTPASSSSNNAAAPAAAPAQGAAGVGGENSKGGGGRGSVDMHVPPGNSGPLGLKA